MPPTVVPTVTSATETYNPDVLADSTSTIPDGYVTSLTGGAEYICKNKRTGCCKD